MSSAREISDRWSQKGEETDMRRVTLELLNLGYSTDSDAVKREFGESHLRASALQRIAEEKARAAQGPVNGPKATSRDVRGRLPRKI